LHWVSSTITVRWWISATNHLHWVSSTIIVRWWISATNHLHSLNNVTSSMNKELYLWHETLTKEKHSMTRDLKTMLFINLYFYSLLISIAYDLGTFIRKSPPKETKRDIP
jgi:hypothetical protein